VTCGLKVLALVAVTCGLKVLARVAVTCASSGEWAVGAEGLVH
jgi:hypothetical protein